MNNRILQVICVTAVTAGLVSAPLGAAAEQHYGRNVGTGYFMGSFSTSPALPLSSSRLVISGATQTDKVNSLMTTLTDNNKSSDNAIRRPAAFTIHTMLGRLASDSPANPATSSDITLLQNRLNAFVSSGGTIQLKPYSYAIETYKQSSSDIAWARVTPASVQAYVFSKDGTNYYAIRESNANVISFDSTTQTLPGIPAVPSGWTATGRVDSDKTEYRVGETVTFRYYLTNNGPDAASNITTRAFFGSSPFYNETTNYAAGEGKMFKERSFQLVPPAKVGDRYCAKVTWTPASSSQPNGTGTSPERCITVVEGYEIQPFAKVSASTAQPGDSVTFNYYADNAGIRSRQTAVDIWKVAVAPGTTLDANWFEERKGNNITCGNYPGNATCDSTNIPPDIQFESSKRKNFPSETVVIPNGAPAGRRICRALSVKPYTGDSQDARHSQVACVTVANSPYAGLVSGDSFAGGKVSTIGGMSCSEDEAERGTNGFSGTRNASKGFGSFSDYGLFATGPIKDFSSAGRVDDLNYKKLTFANKDADKPGYFTDTHCIQDYVQAFSARANKVSPAEITSINPSAESTDYNIDFASDPTLRDIDVAPGGTWTVGKGKKYLIYAPSDRVVIKNNIEYETAGIASFAEAPSVVVVAKAIAVEGKVTRIDGMFYARNNFNTCAEAGADPNAGTKTPITIGGACQNPLVVNGAVIANQAVVPRTFGGRGPGQPSELLVMRPEVFLQPVSDSFGSQFMTTVFEEELPPRY